MNFSMDDMKEINLPTIEEEQKNYESFKRGRFTIVVQKKLNEEPFSIKGKNIVFTGRGPYTRGNLMKMAKEHGAFATSNSISKHTEVLVVGEKPGSKLILAKRNNIKIISMEEFLYELKQIKSK